MDMSPSEVQDTLLEYAVGIYDQREREFTPEMMRKLERTIMLRSIDLQWVEHLTTMDNMRQGIGLEAIGQRDPLVQYKRQSFTMFSDLIDRTESDISRTIFRVALAQATPQQARPSVTAVKPDPSMPAAPANAAAVRAAQAIAGQKSVMSAVNSGHGSDVSPQGRKVGRNEPCPCGSGKKYKRCHGAA
jgi:preprotein translocase subunit SecA